MVLALAPRVHHGGRCGRAGFRPRTEPAPSRMPWMEGLPDKSRGESPGESSLIDSHRELDRQSCPEGHAFLTAVLAARIHEVGPVSRFAGPGAGRGGCRQRAENGRGGALWAGFRGAELSAQASGCEDGGEGDDGGTLALLLARARTEGALYVKPMSELESADRDFFRR